MKQYITLIVLIIFSLNYQHVNAQRWSILKREKQVSLIQGRFSYLATIEYPGINVGVEIPVSSKFYLAKDSITLRKMKYRYVTFNYSFYTHKTFHNNHIISAGYQFRTVNTHRWFLDLEPQLGISRTFMNGATYNVDANGSVKQSKSAGDWFLASNLGFAIGKQLSFKEKGPEHISVFLKCSIFILLPYNNFIYLRPALQLGCIFNLHSTLNRQHTGITKIATR